jgi:hypothetical protein
MSIADLIPHILATRMEPRRPEITEEERLAKQREYNRARRDAWRAERRAKGLPVT